MSTHILSYLIVSTVFSMFACNPQNANNLASESGKNAPIVSTNDSIPPTNSSTTSNTDTPTAKPVTVEQLLARFGQNSDTVIVYNFWATWCKPCIEEMPHFEALGAKYADKKLKIVFVSLDFFEDLDKRVNPFIVKKALKSEVLILNGGNNPNAWIDRIEPTWTGAIPATIILRTSDNYRRFYEREFTLEQLETELLPLLKP